MKRYLFITVVFLLILSVLVACELSWAKPDLAFTDYKLEVDIDDGVIEYSIEGGVNNSGGSGKYEIGMSMLPLMVDDEYDNWVDIETYGPVKADTGDVEFEYVLGGGLTFRIAKVKLQLFSISPSGEKEFEEEVKVFLSTMINPEMRFDPSTINVVEKIRTNEYVYEVSGRILNSGNLGRYKLYTYGLPVGLDESNPDNWDSVDIQRAKVINDEPVDFNYEVRSDNRLSSIAIELTSVDELDQPMTHDRSIININR